MGNPFTSAYYIKTPMWGAGIKYNWPPELGVKGVGIAENIFRQYPNNFMIKCYKNYYLLDRAKLREFYKTHKQNIHNANGTRLLVVPLNLLFDWGREDY